MYRYVDLHTLVCMHACMHACMHVCMYICLYVCLCVCMCACMFLCTYVCLCACMYSCLNIFHMICDICIYIYPAHARTEMRFQESGGGDSPPSPRYNSNCTKERASRTIPVPGTGWNPPSPRLALYSPRPTKTETLLDTAPGQAWCAHPPTPHAPPPPSSRAPSASPAIFSFVFAGLNTTPRT